jgi:hypothetical protein
LNGTTDYLTWSGSTVGTSQFTFECWFYYTGTFGSAGAFCGPGANTNNSLNLYISNATTLNFDQYGVAATSFTVPTMVANTWYHVAFVRGASNACTVFLNGVRSSTGTVALSTNFLNIASIGYVSPAVPRYFQGYLSNVRFTTAAVYDPTATTILVPTQLFPITNTQLLTCQSPTLRDNSTNNFTITAVSGAKVSNFTPFAGYKGFNPALGAAAPGVWTLNEASYYQGNRQWPIYDPFFNQTTLMLHGNGTNGAQNNTFIDSSTNNFAITRNGNTTQGTFTPFSQTGWSTFFNGSTDYLLGGTSSAYTFGTGDLTIELWMWATNTSASTGLIGFGGAVSGVATLFINAAGGTANIRFNASSGTAVTTGNNVWSPNQWNHVAVSRASGTTRIFVNGVLQVSASQTDNLGGADISIGRAYYNLNQEYFSGYLSNIRIIKGTALYTSNFTPSTQPLNVVPNTVLLTCQDNRFVDDSANNFTITPNGSASVQPFSPFVPTVTTPTTYSNYFDGTGDYLSLASNAAFTFGTGDFTIEGWVFNTKTATGRFVLYSTDAIASSGSLSIFQEGLASFIFRIDGGNDISVTPPSLNTWNHIAVTRASGTVRIFINGILSTSATRAQNITQNTPYIGDFNTGGYSLSGCLSNLRVLKGTALYTAAFTPPTAPLTNITNTSLLTCQSSTFIDNSTNNFTITATGNVRPVVSPTPFAPLVDQTTLNTAYSTSLIGGSAYFDGSDYLSVASNAAFTFTGDFTWEGWFYMTANPSQGYSARLIDYNGGSNLLVFSTSDGTDYLGFAVAGTTYTTTTALRRNQWAHVAVSRSGTGSNNLKLFLNGTAISTQTNTSTVTAATIYISNRPSGDGYFTGYIGSYRLTNTGVYTQNFAPPTSPATSSSALLLNFTNAGIIDNTAKNVLETVGNAQISTAQSKWGGSSISFDGTGDYLFSNPATTDLYAFGSGDWTIEFWAYLNSVTGTQIIYDGRPASVTTTQPTIYMASAVVTYYANGTDRITGSTLSIGQWYHIAVSRSGTSTKMFVNGTQAGSTYTDSTVYTNTAGRPVIAANGNAFGTNSLNGYLDDFRVTKGVARYTTNFTPPTSQLQDQ